MNVMVRILIFLFYFQLLANVLHAQLKADDSYLLKISNSQQYLPIGSDANDKIVDLAILYQGGIERLNFTREEIIPYVYRWTTDGELEWLFDGFLFHEDRTFEGHAFEQEAYRFQKNRARKTEWEWLIDRVFEPGRAVSVLNHVIEEQRVIGNVPKRKRKVVLSLPEPLSGQLDWGELNGRSLDFANDADRVEAVKWYIDQLISRYNGYGFQHLELSGFYWLRQDNELSFQLMPEIAAYIKSIGYKFYWRPQYQKHRGKTWKVNGFDAAYLQPNYFLNSSFNKESLVKACTYASLYNMGLEIDIDAAISNSTHQVKFNDYMDVFTQQHVFEKAAMSFSDGGKTYYELSKSLNSVLQGVYKKITDYVATRQKKADKVIQSDVGALYHSNDKLIDVIYNCHSDKLMVKSTVPLLTLFVYKADGTLMKKKVYKTHSNIMDDSIMLYESKGYFIVRLVTSNNQFYSKSILVS